MGFNIHSKIEIIGILELGSPAMRDKWPYIKEFRRIPENYWNIVFFFDAVCKWFNNLPWQRFPFMYTCIRERSKDKTTVRCKSAVGFSIRENTPFLSNEQRAASNEYIISETPKNFELFSGKFCTRIEPGRFMENCSMRWMFNEFFPLWEIARRDFPAINSDYYRPGIRNIPEWM